MDHAQIRKLGGFIHRRHDDTVNFLAHAMTVTGMKQGACNDVEFEPPLQKLTGDRAVQAQDRQQQGESTQ